MNEHDPMASSVYPGDRGTPPPPPSLAEQETMPEIVAVLPPPPRLWFGLPLVGGVFGLVTVIFLIGVVTIYGVIRSHHLFSVAPASTSQSNPHAAQTFIAIQTAMTATPAGVHTTPIANPTTGATPAPTAIPLPLTFTCPPDQGKKNVQVCVHTVPHAQLTITVTDCDGQADPSPALAPTQADSAGNYTWQWRPRQPQDCQQNTAVAQVTATLSGQSAISSLTLNFG